MRRTLSLAGLFTLVAINGAGAADVASLRPFLTRHCVACHDAQTKEHGLDLSALKTDVADQATFDVWVKVHDKIRLGKMPPADSTQPTSAERTAFVTALSKELIEANRRKQSADGRVLLRRLNRHEYERTVHDLLSIDAALKEILPEETPQDGFDTVADGLRLSPLHLEKYLEAADVALSAAIRLTAAPETKKQRFQYKEQEGIRRHIDKGEGRQVYLDLPDAVALFADMSYITKVFGFYPQQTGQYRIRASGWTHQSDKPVMLQLYAGNYRMGSKRLVGYFDLPVGKPREVETIARLDEGEYVFPAPADLDVPADGRNIWQVGAKDYRGSGVALQWIEIEGPLVEAWPPASVRALFGSLAVQPLPNAERNRGNRRAPAYTVVANNPRVDAKTAIEAFATRAFRRPLEAGEADRFVKLAHAALEDGQPFVDAARIGFRAVLTSPQFLLLTEKPGRLDDYAIASRLSYFLWSTLPDEELLRLAAERKLSQPAVLRAQTERMLKSPKARAFIESFVGQWLELRNIDATSPDRRLYPEFDELLKLSMVRETEEFFAEMLDRDLGVANFIQSDFAMLNRRLAEHYGIASVEGEQFRRVTLTSDSHRGGVLTQASVLKVTANGTVTSPVTRGAWVMKHLLGRPPDPPPANVGAIEPDTRGATTVREQLAKHRDSAACNSCHQQIDPPGFALECFDVIGGFRDRYRSLDRGDRPPWKLHGRNIHEYKLGPTVDASGELSPQGRFTGIDQFKRLLLGETEQVARAVTMNLLTYGTGAGIEFADREEVESILRRAKPKNYGLRTLVHEVVQSPVFGTK